MISRRHWQTLRVFANRIRARDIEWAITGSLGLALHGIDVGIGDIDIQTDEHGAYKIERALEHNIVRRVKFSVADRIQSHFGELNVEGVKIEIMGALQKKLSGEVWESPVDVKEHLQNLECDGITLPVLSLDYLEKAYRILGREEKAQLIAEWRPNRGG